MYNPQEEKKKQAKLFEKDFSPVALFLELVTTLFIINPNFLKKTTILFLFTNTSNIITYLLLFCYTQEKNPDLPTLLIYILLILLFLLHHNIDAFKRNDYYFAKTNKYQIFEQKQKPHMQKFCPRKESKQIIILTSLNLLKNRRVPIKKQKSR